MKPYIAYYKKYKIIPTIKINSKNYDTIIGQRDNLYNQLKLDHKLFLNSDVLEVGPGSGYNAYYLIKKGINKITLVEGNDTSVKKINQTLKKVKKNKYEIIEEDFYKVKLNKKFDFVICENVLSGVRNPKLFVKRLSSFVKKNGYLIINCSDSISLFSEKLRGVISSILLHEKKLVNNFNAKTNFLSKIFISHLKSLNKNTRNISDWVQDVLLYEYWWRKKKYFSINEFINVVKKKFVFFSSSPFCFTNYSWYKSLNFNLNKSVLSEFKKIQNNFIDVRVERNFFTYKESNILKILFEEASNEINVFRHSNSDRLTIKLKNIKYFLSKKKFKNRFNKTILSLNSVIIFLQKYKKKRIIDLKKIKEIKNWWGYATQYVVMKKI